MVVTEYGLPCPKSFTAALVTDLHEHKPDEVIRILKEVQPDVIFIAGDTFERHGKWNEFPEKKPSLLRVIFSGSKAMLYQIIGSERKVNPTDVFRFLKEVTAICKAPVFMSLGNHEWKITDTERNAIASAGITLLDNAATQWNEISIGGLSTWWDRDFLEEFSERPGFKVLLCHHPEYYDTLVRDRDIDLVLSGHAHGGQFRFFGKGILAPGQGFFPKYHHGMYEGRLVVSAGCANTLAIPRLGNPCEVVVLRMGAE